MHWLIPAPEHVLSDNVQTTMTGLMIGVVTGNGFHYFQERRLLLQFLSVVLDFLFSRLQPTPPPWDLLDLEEVPLMRKSYPGPLVR